jgi:hypothetical protein
MQRGPGPSNRVQTRLWRVNSEHWALDTGHWTLDTEQEDPLHTLCTYYEIPWALGNLVALSPR